MEAYAYAASIEKYYSLSSTFALAQGKTLPDFGRYHPNHPLGHLLTGFAFDFLKIPALGFMRFINIAGALCAGFFLYLVSLQLRLTRNAAAIAAAFFLASHAGLLAVLSGEWHMPPTALGLAALWQAIKYIENGLNAHLRMTALLLSIGVCYNISAAAFAIPIAGVLCFVRPLRERWRELALAGFIGAFPICVVYFVIPPVLFGFRSLEDFLRTFLIYTHLKHVRYTFFAWPVMAIRALFNAFVTSPVDLTIHLICVGLFFSTILTVGWKFSRSGLERPVKILLIAIPAWWFLAQWIVGARAEGINAWLTPLPILCLIIIKVFSEFRKWHIFFMASLPLLTLTWNLWCLVIPNSLYDSNQIFLFNPPQNISKATPVAFVVGNLVVTMPEIWRAGSELGFRNQELFYPCCGEDNYQIRLKKWLRTHPDAIIVSDFAPEWTESLLRANNFHHLRWSNRQESWPVKLLPATLFVVHEPGYRYRKSLTVWLPPDQLPLY